jgi:hypothetical protein
LLSDARKAKITLENKVVTPEVERIIEANILLAVLVLKAAQLL